MAYDASPSTTHNPAAGGTPTAAWGDIINENFAVIGGAWTAYTPTWTASTVNPALGNGSLVGGYTKLGKLLIFRIFLTAGGTTTFGTGYYLFSLPSGVTAASAAPQPVSAWLLDGSTNYSCTAVAGAGASSLFVVYGATLVTGAAPFAWGSTDQLSITGMIEVD